MNDGPPYRKRTAACKQAGQPAMTHRPMKVRDPEDPKERRG